MADKTATYVHICSWYICSFYTNTSTDRIRILITVAAVSNNVINWIYGVVTGVPNGVVTVHVRTYVCTYVCMV